ncbi:NDMA-dependent alcohol dehydrogenase [Pseudonocardia hispaniensis]|uniref:NDMA-dependent alcohol dehydrogenase n=1 Tax=Pseudonocardia hispaniensis TaxID=904933 RepID=A0ABW1IZ08_9PSEU
MKTRAAVVFAPGEEWEVVELELDPPKAGEVQVQMVAAGLCHSDEHMRLGELKPRYPLVGGHEGAGIVTAVGTSTSRLAVGDHVVFSFRPVCGRCRYCVTGKSNLCNESARLFEGCLPDGTFRFHHNGEDVGANSMLGTFSEHAVVPEISCITVPKDLPLEVMALLGCAVPTGWGAAVHSAAVRPGDVCVVLGAGGVGSNAVQGAVHAGARQVMVLDPSPAKTSLALTLGATQAFTVEEDLRKAVHEATHGDGADQVIVAAGVPGLAETGFSLLRKAGTLVLAALGDPEKVRLDLPVALVARADMVIRGSALGECNVTVDIPRLIEMYRQGSLKLDELVSGRYSLDQIRQGYQDLHSGANLRGVIIH